MKTRINRQLIKRALLVFLLFGAAIQPGFADSTKRLSVETFQVTTPAEAGFSQQRLERLTATIESTLQQKEIPGAAAMIMRNGHVVYQQVFGSTRSDNKSQIEMDTIFRI